MHCARVFVLNIVSNDAALFPARLYHFAMLNPFALSVVSTFVRYGIPQGCAENRADDCTHLLVTLLMTEAVPNGAADDAANNEPHTMITVAIPSATVLSFLPAVALWRHHLDILDNRHNRHDVRLNVFNLSR